jgi:hypothetical protein
MTFKIDKEKTKQKIALVLNKISAEADPQLLNEYRKLFKGIPFFRRSWAAAYLLMLHDAQTASGGDVQSTSLSSRTRGTHAQTASGGDVQSTSLSSRTGGTHAQAPERSRGGSGASAQANPPGQRARGGQQEPRGGQGRSPAAPSSRPPPPVLSDEESRRLFISIGRNRHLFPREILGLIINKAQVAREDIGMIRILDSYSFVQVRDTAADTIIEALNGTMFRGRTLAVNYARSKREEGTVEEDAVEEGAADLDGAVDTDSSNDPVIDDENFTADPEDEDLDDDDLDDDDLDDDDDNDDDSGESSEQGDDQGDEEGI